jgi:thymidylate kinase
MLWMKPLLTGGIVKERYVDDILRVSSSHPEQFSGRMISTFGQPLADQVWPLIKQGRLSETITYQRRLAWTAWWRAVSNSPIKTLLSSLSHLISELARRALRKPATFISVVGPDGAGKTTFIDLLQQELARILIKDQESIKVTHFRPNILPNIKQLISGQKYDASAEEFSNPHRAPPANPPSSLVRLAYYWLDYLFGYWLVNRRKCAQGTVMIFDRYFYDFIVDPRRSRINLPTWVRKLFLLLTPQPDLVFFLDCDADTVYERKQELTRDEIERQLVEYRKLVIADPKRFIRLDAHQLPQISCRHALRELVLRSFQRV